MNKVKEWISNNKGELIIAIVPSILAIVMAAMIIVQVMTDIHSDLSRPCKITFGLCGLGATMWAMISFAILDFRRWSKDK